MYDQGVLFAQKNERFTVKRALEKNEVRPEEQEYMCMYIACLNRRRAAPIMIIMTGMRGLIKSIMTEIMMAGTNAPVFLSEPSLLRLIESEVSSAVGS